MAKKKKTSAKVTKLPTARRPGASKEAEAKAVVAARKKGGADIDHFLKKYIEVMGWDDLNWLEDVHMGYEEGRAAVFDRNVNGWVTVPKDTKLPDNQQDRDMIARELLIKFQMSPQHPMVQLKAAYRKF